MKSESRCVSFAARIFPANLMDVGESLATGLVEAVGLWEAFVLQAHPRDSPLFQFSNQPPNGIEVPPAGIAVDENRKIRGIRHELSDLQDLTHARFVAIANPEGGGHGKTTGPYRLETSLFDELRGESVVCLHDDGGAQSRRKSAALDYGSITNGRAGRDVRSLGGGSAQSRVYTLPGRYSFLFRGFLVPKPRTIPRRQHAMRGVVPSRTPGSPWGSG